MLMRFSLSAHRIWFLLSFVGIQELAFYLLTRDGYGYELAQVKVIAGSIFRLLFEVQIALLISLLPRVVAIFCAFLIYLFLLVAVPLQIEGDLLLTASLIRSNFTEGMAVMGNGLSLSRVTWIFTALWLLSALASFNSIIRFDRVGIHARMLLLVIPVVLMDWFYVQFIDPPERIRTYIPVKRLMLSYGYVGMFAADLRFMAFSDNQQRYAEFLNGYNFSGGELPEPLPKRPSSIYLIQWESLDAAFVDQWDRNELISRLWMEIGGRRVLAEHLNGSADTDYSVNTGLPTPRSINPYLLKPVGKEAYLPELMERSGYESVFVHCNTGKFFSRAKRVDEFGYERIYWSESFANNFEGRHFWGLDDKECVRQMSERVVLEAGQFLYFITLTSHYPYRNIQATETLEADIQSRYLLEIRNTSQALESLLGQLPEGSLVMIFGDHQAIGMADFEKVGTTPLICGVLTEGRLNECPLPEAAVYPLWQLPQLVSALVSGAPPQMR